MGRRATGSVEARETSIRIKFSWQGRRVAEKLDLAPTAPNLRAAQKTLDEILRRIASGTFHYVDFFPESAKAEAADGSTWGEVSDRWVSTLTGAKSTIESYKTGVNFWKSQFGEKPIAALVLSDLKRAVATLDKQVAAKTVNNYLVPLRSVFDLAVGDNQIAKDANHAEALENLKRQTPEPDPLDPDEMNAVLAYMAERYPAAALGWYEFAFCSGLRPSEQVALTNGHIDWRRRKAKIETATVLGEDKDTKTHQVRYVDLSARAIEALERMKPFTFMLGSEARIFINPNTGAPWSGNQVQRRLYWTPALRALGLRQRDAYQTRHTYATVSLMGGVNIAYIAKQLGHTKVTTTLNTYARWIEDADKGREAAKLDALFAAGQLAGQLRGKSGATGGDVRDEGGDGGR
jgi:integrase